MSKEPTDPALKIRIKSREKELALVKKNETELRRNKLRYEEEINNFPVGFFRLSLNNLDYFSMGNPAVIKMFGYQTLDEFTRTSVQDFFWNPEDYKSFSKKLKLYGEVAYEEIELKKKNGTPIWTAITANVILSDTDGPMYYYGIVADIDERKRAEQLLMQEKKFSETVIESMPGLFFMLDENYRYVKWNRNAKKLYGYDLEEIASTELKDVIAEKDIPVLIHSFAQAKKGKSGYAEYTVIAKDGRRIPLAGEACNIRINDTEYLIGMEIDISRLKNAEKKLKTALKELRKIKNQLKVENIYLKEQINFESVSDEIIGNSRELNYVMFKIRQVAPTDSTVLIQGETGVGKGMVAKVIHDMSRLKDHPLVKVNCAALPASLIENELFGHERGAFTGAGERKLGRFEIANGSTIFLDEVSELPLELQAKLLQVVEDGEMERLGGTRTIKVNVRILAATNRDLEDEVRAGRFRKDLWYRLNVFPITVPPLRDRKEDIQLLVEYFVKQLGMRMGKSINQIPQNTIRTLKEHPWPGNIRELRNVIERAVIETNGNVLQFNDPLSPPASNRSKKNNNKPLAEMEREYITRILEKMDWRISGPKGAANVLKLKESTLRARMKKLGISRP